MIAAARAAGEPTEPADRIVRAWTRWLIDDPSRAGSDQNCERLRVVLDGVGDDTMHRLLETTGDRMNIASAEVVITSPSRNFVTLKLTTDDGVVGLGDATLNGRELAVAAYLRDHVVPLLLDRDAHRIEDTWQYLYRGAYWRRGPVTMAAIGAVDTALWDIKGKVAGLPLYQLLGGASRSGLLAYGHASGTSMESLSESITAHLERGYRAIRVQSAVPGIRSLYGVAAQTQASGERYDYEPAGRGLRPVEEDWDSAAYLRHVPKVFEHVRQEFGPELPLLHDVHHRLRPIEAATLGKRLEPYDLFWLEDCTPAENQQGLRLVRQHTTIAACDRRGVQHRLGFPDADLRTADRLRARLRDPLRWRDTAAQGDGLRRAVPDPLGFPRPDRCLACRARGAAARRPRDPQLRDPGVHAAQLRRPTPCSSRT